MPAQGQIYTTANPYRIELTTQGAHVLAETPAIALAKGENRVVVMGLSSDTRLDQVQYFLGEAVSVVRAELINDSTLHFNDLELKEIGQDLLEAQDSLRGVLFTESQIAYLKTILDQNKRIEVSDKSIYIDDLDELLTFYKRRLRSLQRDLNTAKLHKKRLIHQIDSLKKAKRRRLTTLAPPVHGVGLNLVADFDMEQTVRIAFFTHMAKWTPQYALVTDNENANLEVNASIEQNTGVNWKQVELHLSYNQTGDWKQANGGRHSVTYPVKHPIQLGNGQSLFIPNVSNYQVDTRQVYLCDPTLSHMSQPFVDVKGLSGVFLPTGMITIKTATNGQVMDSFTSGIFQDSMSFALPLTHDVASTKFLVKEKLSNSLVGNKVSSKVEWTATVTNSTPMAQTIVFRDRIPFASANPNVLIEYNLPKGGTQFNGYFEQTLQLEANESIELNYGFQITAPKGTNLTEYIEK